MGTRHSILRASALADRRAYDQAADLHIASIHHGLLPDLGRRFLSRLYVEIDRTPRAGVWVATRSDRVVGFLAGCADTSACYRSVLARAGLPLAWLAGSAVLAPSVLGRLPTLVSYPFKSVGGRSEAEDEPAAELLAIAVDEAARGHGLGSSMIASFERALQSWGVGGRYQVATNADDLDSNRFYERVGFSPTGRRRHNALTLQVYSKLVGPGGD